MLLYGALRLYRKFKSWLYHFSIYQNHFFKDFLTGKYQDSHIVLIQAPGWGVSTPPFAIASLSAYLRSYDFKVMPVDINIEMYQRNKEKYRDGWLVDVTNFWTNPSRVENFIYDNKKILDRYTEAIIQSKAKVIGFTIYESSYLVSCCLAKKIKSKAKDRVIIFGGPGASEFMLGKSILRDNPDVDFVVEGEGEEALLEIVQKFFSHSEITECAGARYRRNAEVVIGPQREPIKSLDALPFPDFSDFYFSLYKEPFKIPISSSRGCINQCIYCNERAFWKQYRSRSAESMFAEIEHQLRKYPGIFFFDFQDSLVNGNIRALERLCGLIIDRGIRIQWAGQAIIRKEMRYELFVKLKKSGCVNLAYGLETVSASLLEKAGKVFSKGVNINQMLTDSQRAGLDCTLNFMFGLPGETDEEAGANIDFVRKNADKIATVNPSPGFCLIGSGTLAYAEPAKYGIDLSKGSSYWESIDGSNNFLKRLERFEKFVAVVHELGMRSVYSHPKLTNKNEAIANYYFAIENYEKAIPYYEDALKYEPVNQLNIDRLKLCYSYCRIDKK